MQFMIVYNINDSVKHDTETFFCGNVVASDTKFVTTDHYEYKSIKIFYPC